MNFIKNESAQKLRGGYYTPHDIAIFLARWVLAIGPKRVLEPSCGDGSFLGAIASLRPKSLRDLSACEIDKEEAEKAKLRTIPGVDVSVRSVDFLQWAIDKFDTKPDVDGVLGNPPFIRYQYLNVEQQDRARTIFDRYGLSFTKHTNAWVPFVVASVARLRPGGRLGMVVPAELLHVLHAQSLRAYLLGSCSRILVIDPESLWFEGSLQGVVLLLVEKALDDKTSGSVAITKFKGQLSLDNDPCALFDNAQFIDGSVVRAKWMPALLSDSERAIIAELSSKPHVRRFDQLADVDVGIITGANKFFLVPDDVVDMYDLRDFAQPMFGKSNHVRGVIYDQARHEENKKDGLSANFLRFGATDKAQLPKAVQRYIATGENEGLHKRYKCRIRTPWYAVPSVYVAPMGMLKRSHDFHRMILNRAGALTTDTAYRIQPLAGTEPSRLVFSFINSLTALSAELEGRHYGGGVLELVPSEIERLLIPWSDAVPCDIDALDRDISGQDGPATVLAAQDKRLLRCMGVRQSDADDLRAAWLRLRDRRQRNTTEDEADSEEEAPALPRRRHSTTMKKGVEAPGGGP